MKIGPKYRVPFKRRLKGQTNYRRRLRLLLSGKPRLVVRKSLRYIRAQIIEFHPRGDRVLVSASSQELKKFGWKGSALNIPSSYLVGLLIGKRALKKRIKSAVLDIGVQKSIKGSRIYALLKGVMDAGLKVPHSPDVLPPEDRIKGEHIVKYAKELKEGNKERYRIQFSRTNPEELPRMFEEVKSKIVG